MTGGVTPNFTGLGSLPLLPRLCLRLSIVSLSCLILNRNAYMVFVHYLINNNMNSHTNE